MGIVSNSRSRIDEIIHCVVISYISLGIEGELEREGTLRVERERESE